ncbi:hypothetical protein GCM10010435_83930 [Winogradskya consettensis]|uniref:DUF4352 domain-containing protein n=1 Tax=Winogradskya consettensis TaxID=113560 RepID=A0A919VY76_9ACTN|nr:hypothetical protein [Actinoplanes consettensis]GIM82156.1 hypothetical protein Aco04nite_80170 [Actinoplanes consettensis]
MKKPLVVAVVVIGLGAAASLNSIGVAAADQQPVPAVVASTAVASVTVQAPPAIKDSDPSLTYGQDGRIVTVTRKSTPVATVTLASATWSAHSATAVLTVTATRPIIVDPAMFTLYDAEGWENQAQQSKPVRFGGGTASLTLTFTGTPARPEALGWVPQPDGDAVAVWERG